MPVDSLSIQSGICSSTGGGEKGTLTFILTFLPVLKLETERKLMSGVLRCLKLYINISWDLVAKYQIPCKHFSQAYFF